MGANEGSEFWNKLWIELRATQRKACFRVPGYRMHPAASVNSQKCTWFLRQRWRPAQSDLFVCQRLTRQKIMDGETGVTLIVPSIFGHLVVLGVRFWNWNSYIYFIYFRLAWNWRPSCLREQDSLQPEIARSSAASDKTRETQIRFVFLCQRLHNVGTHRTIWILDLALGQAFCSVF